MAASEISRVRGCAICRLQARGPLHRPVPAVKPPLLRSAGTLREEERGRRPQAGI